MGNLTVFNVYDEFSTTYQPDPDFTIDFHKKNAIFFNNYTKFKDEEELVLYIELIWMFIDSLYKKQRYNLVLEESSKSLKIIDGAINGLNKESLKSTCQWYYGTLFFRALANYYLHDYLAAKILFKSLVKLEPENDSFKLWLINATYKNQSKLLVVINILCAGLVFFEIVFKSSIEPHSLRIILPAMGAVGILSVMIYETSLKRKLKRAKTFYNPENK